MTTSHEGFNHRRTLHDGPVDTTPFRIKDNTSRIPRMLRGFLLRSRTTQTQRRLVLSLILPFGCFQHVIKQGRGGSLLNTQNIGIKTPPDPHVDCSVQFLRKTRDPGFQRVTVPSVPGLPPCMKQPARSSQSLTEPREGREQSFWSWKPPACDSGPQPSITPSGRGLLPATPARHPGIVTPPPLRSIADAGSVPSSLSPSPIWMFGRRAWSS